MSRVVAVFRKEIVDSVRDRRTLIVMLVTAVAAGPLLLMLVMQFVAGQADRARVLRLPVVAAEHAPAVISFLQRQQVEIVGAPADFEARIRDGELDVVLVIADSFATDVAKGKAGIVRLVYDRSRDRARVPIEQIESLLRLYNRDWGQGRLLLRGIAPQVANPLQVEAHDLATPQSSGSLILFMIAYYGLFACVMGGMAAAIDTTAGERERQSLEPLLITPVRSTELATGKWLAVVTLTAAVVIVTLAGFYLTLRFGPVPSVGVPFLFGTAELGRFLVILLPLALLMPAVLLYVGGRGRTFKEAQSNSSVVIFAVSVVPIVQLMMQSREPRWLSFVPIASQYSLLGRALRGEALPGLELAQSYAAPLLLTFIALLALARLLSREAMLAGR
ncbi:MAG: ABC transporter permease [Pseudomonadota bacterium]|nr:ABC transporter permease [Pseudomonadota bacterium]